MGKPSYWRDFKSVISMWSLTWWIENWVINLTRLWYNRVALLYSDGISNHLFCIWSLTRWTWNWVIKFTWLWYSRVVLLFTSPLHISASNAILLIIFKSVSPHFQNFVLEVGVISLSSQVRNSFSSLKYIENFMV